jgi:hypothetical protein
MQIVHPNSKKSKRSVRVAPVDCEPYIRFKYAGEDEPIQQILNSWAFVSGLPITSRGVANQFAASFQGEPMHIEKIKSSNLLKPGELLVVPKCYKLYGDSALLHLPGIAEIGLLQILPTSSGTGSQDQPGEAWQNIPAPENNERAKSSLQQQRDGGNPPILWHRPQAPAKTKMAYVAQRLS